MSSQIHHRLELARLELLDMGLRGNSLLHFKPGARAIEVIDEKSREIFRLLVEEQKTLTFLPLPDNLAEQSAASEDTLPDLQPWLDQNTQRHNDTKLQTPYNSITLDKQLLKISTDAKTFAQEQGVDIVYLALGFLHWYEDSAATNARCAPLILVPVILERQSARERYRLLYTQTDLGPNLTLGAKLKAEFQLELPAFAEEFVVADYFAQVKMAISSQPRWHLAEDEIALGFFSFGKFQMYQDLDGEIWPQNLQPIAHPLLTSLLGSDARLLNAGETTALNEPLTSLCLVKDADSSQTDAVLAVKAGHNLVIQGPPGTGKSQTITNIIAQAIADQKTVLFVAEKIAALNVVKKRLDETQLGAAVLELHSHKTNKKMVMEELNRTLSTTATAPVDPQQHYQQHQQTQLFLDGQLAAVNDPLSPADLNYIATLGLWLQSENKLPTAPLPTLDFAPMASWTAQDFANAKQLVQELSNHLALMGCPQNNVFAQTKLLDFSPMAQQILASEIPPLAIKLQTLTRVSAPVSEYIGCAAAENLAALQQLINTGFYLLDKPDIRGFDIQSPLWRDDFASIQNLLRLGQNLLALKAKRAGELIAQAWQANVLPLRQIWINKADSFFNFLSAEFKHAKRELQGYCQGELPEDNATCLGIIDDILAYQALQQEFARAETQRAFLFGPRWQGENSDFSALAIQADGVNSAFDSVARQLLHPQLIDFLQQSTQTMASENVAFTWDKTALQTWSQAKTEAMQQLSTLCETVGCSLLPEPLTQSHFSALQTKLDQWLNQLDELHLMARYNRLSAQLSNAGLASLSAAAFHWQGEPSLLLLALERCYYQGLLTKAYQERPLLRQFDRLEQENRITQFRELDHQLLEIQQKSLQYQHLNRLPKAHNQDPGIELIRHEINKKRRHIPIRSLLAKAGSSVQAIKPIFMMSPMSVATYLTPGAVNFDLVIFDEASQVKVVDALGSIVRGKQVVVVGDTEQMPPTDFFNKSLELDDEAAEESQTADVESILSMFLAKGAAQKMLRWHYRSRHESLIAVSNQEFYQQQLMIFPSNGFDQLAQGVKLHYLPDALYDKGASRTNPLEAKAVAQAVMQHAKNQPQLSLGVVAFSSVQRDAIIVELERLRRLDASLEGFFNEDNAEAFFVKNLENVQGDERDIIMISIGYGRMADGKMTGNFGPLNRDGGHRRLNVLITRARLTMEVFCNFNAEELAVNATSPRGISILKTFLQFAEQGKLVDKNAAHNNRTLGPFEQWVMQELATMGYKATPQLGNSGLFIDLAIADNTDAGRYILAIETDGANSATLANTRDRERLRYSVMMGLNWRIYRLWSCDWFKNPAKAKQQLVDAIEDAVSFYQAQQADKINASAIVHNNAAADTLTLPDLQPQDFLSPQIYTLYSAPTRLSADTTRNAPHADSALLLASDIIATEAPIHIKALINRFAEQHKIERITPSFTTLINEALDKGAAQDCFFQQGDFIYRDANRKTSLRNRADTPGEMRNIDWICDEEILAALNWAQHQTDKIKDDDLIVSALECLGFSRVSEKARERLARLIAETQPA